MPLPGGPSDKAGNRYEARWTVVCLAGVLRGEFETIRLEPPGPDGEGIEFWLARKGTREYHQVKVRGSRRGAWTLRELGEAGVLGAFRNHLADETASCVFVSSQDALELRELADRARSAVHIAEFEREFTKGEWSSRFSHLLEHWRGCAREEVFSLLWRVHVRIIDEDTLRRQAELALTPVVEGDVRTVSDVLFAYSLESVHQELTCTQIETHLTSRGFYRPIWARPQALAEVVQNANQRYTNRVGGELIRDELIPRDEATGVLAAIDGSSQKRGAVVTGGAGAGKSTVLLQVIESLRTEGIPVLAVRVDLLSPTQQPDELGKQLGLPASPVTTLATLAAGRRCVLIFDQLDAVSLTSGRNPEFFECFDEMMRTAQTLPEMRVVIACRRFDFENDHRLLRLGSRDGAFTYIEVGTLTDDVVRRTVQSLGIEPSRLAPHQIKLLLVPANLKLLCEVAEGTSTSLDFQTAYELYGRYWDRKDRLLRARLGPTLAWSSAIDRLCEHMSDRQALSAPAALLDDISALRDALLSEHVLVKDGARLSFFHEGFFDYAFARCFAANGGDLIGLLRSGEQHLFRRAQVRQILLHEREGDRGRYLENLKTLLSSSDIRFHIKQVVFALLQQFTDPVEAEWRILETLLQKADCPYRSEAWSATRTLPWFRLLDSLGLIKSWLEDSDAATVDNAVVLLSNVQHAAADRVAELVEPHLGSSDAWRNRFRSLVQYASVHAGRRFFELFLRGIENGDLDGIEHSRQGDFFSFLFGLPEKCPDWACEAVGHYLIRCMTISVANGHANPFSRAANPPRSQLSDRILLEAAQGAPLAFVKHVFPFTLNVIELNSARNREKPWRDDVWQYRLRDGGHGIEGHLISALEEALRRLARDNPPGFAQLAAWMRDFSDYETVQFLLMRAYAANGSQFADEAMDYLCESSTRLASGYIDSDHLAASELIQATTPYCSSERLAKLEAMLLTYYTEWEGTANGFRFRGFTQFALLLAVDEKRRSDGVRSRIGEWQRKFQTDEPPESPRTFTCSFDPSPISCAAAQKMTDDHWLGAIASYPKDHGHLLQAEPVGGAIELSRTMQAQVRSEPQRFARLILRFPDAANPVYYRAVLQGLDAGTAEPDAIFEACRRCHRLPSRPTGSAFCHLVEKLPALQWPDDLLEAIAWYATEDPDPARELWRPDATSSQGCYGGDIYTAGINCVRGSAAGAVRALLHADKERLPRLLPTLRRMVSDPSIAVRSCVVTALYPVWNQDRSLAIELFLKLCDTEDVLLKTQNVERFLRFATPTHFSALIPIVERMLGSGDPDVAQCGARRACVASLVHEEAAPLAERCLAGWDPLRLGAAEVWVANLDDARFRQACASRLSLAFNDRSEDVRAMAASCFDRLIGESLGLLTELVESFLGSAAFTAHHRRLLRALRLTTARLPEVTLSACDKVARLAAEIGEGRRMELDSPYDTLLVRAYHQADNEDLRRRCLDAIDKITRIRDLKLAEYER